MHPFEHILGDQHLDSLGEPEVFKGHSGEISREMDQWVCIIELVTLSGRYNKDCCWIKVNHELNFPLLESLLGNYDDPEILEFLKFGFPIDRDWDFPLEMGGN